MKEPLIEAAESTVKDEIRFMLQGAGYGFVVERIEQAIKRAQGDLERDADHGSSMKLRGKLEGLRQALSVPEILLREAEGGMWASEAKPGAKGK